jgi:hypothetical protein
MFNSIAPVKRAARSAAHADVADHSFMVAGTRMGVCMRNGFFGCPPGVLCFQVVKQGTAGSLTAHFDVRIDDRLRLSVGSPRSKRWKW